MEEFTTARKRNSLTDSKWFYPVEGIVLNWHNLIPYIIEFTKDGMSYNECRVYADHDLSEKEQIEVCKAFKSTYDVTITGFGKEIVQWP